MRGISMSITSTSGHRVFIFSRAKMGSEAVAMTSIPGSSERAWATTWRTRAESSTIMTLILLDIMIPAISAFAFGKGQPDMAACEVEGQFAAAAAAHMFRNEEHAGFPQQLASLLDVATADIRLSAGAGKHQATAKEFGLKVCGTASPLPDVVQQEEEGFVTKAAIRGLAPAVLPTRQDEMTHPAKMQAGMPEGDGDTGAEQGVYLQRGGSKIQIPGPEKDLGALVESRIHCFW